MAFFFSNRGRKNKKIKTEKIAHVEVVSPSQCVSYKTVATKFCQEKLKARRLALLPVLFPISGVCGNLKTLSIKIHVKTDELVALLLS